MHSTKGTILVTGGNSGIGFETVTLFLDQGYKVVTADIRVDRLEATYGNHEHIEFARVDLADERQLDQFCSAITSQHSPVDVLINNAGYSLRGILEEVPLPDIRNLFEINVFVPIRITQACLPGMREQQGGTIINVSSIAGKFTFPGNGPYSAAKHAVESMTDALRHEVAPFGIRVVAVRPAFISTAFNETALEKSQSGSRNKEISPYASISQRAAQMLGQLWEKLEPMEPSHLAELFWRIVNSDAPEPSYAIGPMAEEFLEKRAAASDADWQEYMDDLTGLSSHR